jgi:hypothetical protein
VEPAPGATAGSPAHPPDQTKIDSKSPNPIRRRHHTGKIEAAPYRSIVPMSEWYADRSARLSVPLRRRLRLRASRFLQSGVAIEQQRFRPPSLLASALDPWRCPY